ncbi:MAG TPA: amidohydrolase family protein, partial [Nitrospirota bacterium]
NKLALRKHLRLSMHVAESKDEIKMLRRKKNRFEKLYRAVGWDTAWAPSTGSPFEYLHKLGLLNDDFLAVHAVQTTEKDISLIKRSRVSVAHCPRSNKETGVGKMPLKKFLDAGVVVGLGTDSLASSPSLNLWDEMRYAYRIHRSDGITVEDIFAIATAGGAKALGMFDMIGSIEPGKRADIIAVPLPKKDTGDTYSDLLRETKSCIMSVVDGKVLFRDRCVARGSIRSPGRK